MAIIQSMFYIPTALLYAGCRRPDNPSAENIDFLETLIIWNAPFAAGFLEIILNF